MCSNEYNEIKALFFFIFFCSSGDVDPGFQQQQLLQHAAIISSNIDDKEVILAAQDTHDHYYSESDDSVDFSPTRKAKAPSKKKASPKKQMKIKIEPKSANTSMIDTQFVDIKQDIELLGRDIYVLFAWICNPLKKSFT